MSDTLLYTIGWLAFFGVIVYYFVDLNRRQRQKAELRKLQLQQAREAARGTQGKASK